MTELTGYWFTGTWYLRISVDAEGRIISVVKEKAGEVPAEGPFLAPGFFDNQVNGYLGVEFSDPALTADDLLRVVRALRREGVTRFLPTLITASGEALEHSFRLLSGAVEHFPEVAAAVPGFHLEGPYISPAEGARGAHSPEHIRRPDWREFTRFQRAAGGRILQVTLAPEVEGALPFIRRCRSEGIVVALGHHQGTAEEISRAAGAGARLVTHLGNGMANTIHRFENPFWMQLADDRLTCTLILDGIHLRPEMVKVFYRAKGPQRLILTSDTTRLAGLAPGEYVWDGKEVILTTEGMIRLKKEGYFAGASLPLRKGVGNVMKFAGCTLSEAIRMVTSNPARFYGISKGKIPREGERADLVLFRVRKGEIRILHTVTGRYSAPGESA